jgi:hypothetical protein
LKAIATEEAEGLARLKSELYGPDFLTSLRDYDKLPASSHKKLKPMSPDKRECLARMRTAKERDAKPSNPTICSWSSSMCIMDYVTATGIQRSAIEDFLRYTLHARVNNPDRPRYKPGLYSVAVNLEVLAQWIGHWVRNGDHARGLAVATLDYARVHDAAFVDRLIRTLAPVLARRGVSRKDLLADVKLQRDHYAPKTDPLSKQLGLTPKPFPSPSP